MSKRIFIIEYSPMQRQRNAAARARLEKEARQKAEESARRRARAKGRAEESARRQAKSMAEKKLKTLKASAPAKKMAAAFLPPPNPRARQRPTS